ncbi:MAG: hypothetical protein MPJ50_14905 [Pirellulales bacterium]|nr:hypothetical protein [Pirellulales bacterium]
MKLTDLFHKRYCPSKQMKARLVLLESQALKSFRRFLRRIPTTEDLTPEKLKRFEKWMQKRGRRMATVYSYRRALTRLRDWCIDNEFIEPPLVASELVTFSTHKPYSVFEENIERIRARGSQPPECLVDAAIQYADERSLSCGQTRNMIKMARDFEAICGPVDDFQELTEELVNVWITQLAERNLKPGTVNRKRGDMLVLWRSLADRDLCKYPNVRRVKRIKVKPQIPQSASREQIETLLKACQKMDGRFRPHGQSMGRVLVAWIHVAWDGALRPWADQLHLRHDHIRPDGVVVMIQSKTGYPHVFRLRDVTRKAINAIRPKDAERVFPVGYKQMERAWLELQSISGLSIPPKMIRSARATDAEALEAGSAPRVLGHKPGSKVAYAAYVDPRLAYGNPAMPPELDSKPSSQRP